MPAYYTRTVRDFLRESPTQILGHLVTANAEAKFVQLQQSATEAWHEEISQLQIALQNVTEHLASAQNWGVLLEFVIPRRQKRADIILLAPGLIFVIESKTGSANAEAARQVEDYCLDLADFHEPSRSGTLVPIVVSASCVRPTVCCKPTGSVRDVVRCDWESLPVVIYECALQSRNAEPIDIRAWDRGAYYPVPTIIEAAQAIFAGMEVREIAHAHSDPHNLTATVDTLIEICVDAAQHRRKCVCFVTGVPGSGKTLAGLRAVHDERIRQMTGTEATFLSGNGPLVRVLREALTRDFARRLHAAKHSGSPPIGSAEAPINRAVADALRVAPGDVHRKERRAEIKRRVQTLIENVHVFARTYYGGEESKAPNNHVIVFDEAQRAWDATHNKKKFGRDISEPEMLLSIMDRHEWCVVIALVGGGQEINQGEAGLREWGRAVVRKFRNWHVFASDEALVGGPSVAGHRLFAEDDVVPTCHRPELHLPVSARSYKALAVTEWSNALLKGNIGGAADALRNTPDFPVFITRNLDDARHWLKRMTRGSARCGLVASSGATRLRAYGIETATSFHRDYPYEYWFLNGQEDVRSSYQVEVVATEFEIQGLELDWVGVCWGGDLVWDGANWATKRFVGSQWRRVVSPSACEYLVNSYRVLLTRARQGMVIWLPPGIATDSTLPPAEYDATAAALRRSGIRELVD